MARCHALQPFGLQIKQRHRQYGILEKILDLILRMTVVSNILRMYATCLISKADTSLQGPTLGQL